MEKIKSNLQTFFVIWLVVLILNQGFIFGACFALYCIMAALPHTGIIAAVLTIYSIREESKNKHEVKSSERATNSPINIRSSSSPKKPVRNIERDEENNCCPKCGSAMVLRTAKKGRFVGKKFWGCDRFPKCNGIKQL